MEITIVRQYPGIKSTIGKVSLNGVYFSYSLEDPFRAIKIDGQTCIPYGRYRVIITYSNRFKCDMPLLLNVPNFTGIRFHPLNRPDETEGCIGVGYDKAENWIGRSKAAYDALFERIKRALDAGDKVYCSIERGTVPIPEPRGEGFVA